MKATNTLCFLLLFFFSAGKAMEQYEQDEVLAIGCYLNCEDLNLNTQNIDEKWFDIEPIDFSKSLENNAQDLAKNYPCTKPGCTKKYTTLQNRNRHELCSHGEKRLKCTDCDYECNYLYELKEHFRIHMKEKEDVLSTRGFKSRKKNQGLKRTSEVLEKNYPCTKPGCTKKYTTPQNRNRHELCSHGEKRLKCTDCDYECNYLSRLSAHHEHIHNKKKIFPCKFCPKKFTRPSYASRHEDICQFKID